MTQNSAVKERPSLISEEERAQNAQLHNIYPLYGTSGVKRALLIQRLAAKIQTNDVLDYGAGKGTLAQAMPFPIKEYDPAVPGKEASPEPADLVACTDVLEHIPHEYLNAVLKDIARCTAKMAYVQVHTGPAVKIRPDGRNAHLIQKNAMWWLHKLNGYFAAHELFSTEMESHFICAPLPPDQQMQDEAGVFKIAGIKFYTPNAITLGRAQTLLTKEPGTIKWLDRMAPGEVLYDVGANVGVYTLYAAQRGVKVYAFEPEAENYAMLCRNIALNNFDADAYCVAVSDKSGLNKLHLSTREVGRSCHSFGAAVGPNLQERKGPTQGSVGVTIDELTKALSPPNHIKVDVDGLEWNVIRGAVKTLDSQSLKTVQIELNPEMPEHAMVKKFFAAKGWYLSADQVKAATRPSGDWKGYAEHVFHKLAPVAKYTLERIRNTPVAVYPFPHIFVSDVFDRAMYQAMISSMPDDSGYKSLEEARGSKGYPERFCWTPDSGLWRDLSNFMLCGALKDALCEKFAVEGERDEILVIRDKPGYQIGPHTDTPKKVLSALFYLPKTELPDAGTSLYTPKDVGFTCPGGAHHRFEKFNRVTTMPFMRNSMFAFAKSDRSFHGVEKQSVQRDVLLYDIQKC